MIYTVTNKHENGAIRGTAETIKDGEIHTYQWHILPNGVFIGKNVDEKEVRKCLTSR